MLIALLLQAAAAAPAVPASGEIVVVGQRVRETGDALARCLARHCPPKEDIDLSLAYASAQLAAGDYHGSRRTLLATKGRNARFASELPVEVAEVHRSNARVAGMNGLYNSARIGMFDVVDALEAGLDRDDARVLIARLEVGDTFAGEGRIDTAVANYRGVARDSRRIGVPLVEGMALFRQATLLATMASVDTGWEPRARAAAAEVMRSTDPAWVPFRNGLRLVPAILAKPDRQEALVVEAMRAMEPYDYGSPKILFAPQVDLTGVGFGAARGSEPEWIDLRFRVDASGKVADLEEVERTKGFSSTWLPPIERALRLRRYSKPTLRAGAPDPIRTERYAFVSDLVQESGSNLRRRSSRRRLDVLDLTPPSER